MNFPNTCSAQFGSSEFAIRPEPLSVTVDDVDDIRPGRNAAGGVLPGTCGVSVGT
jgi:hypothetical protein